jgi:organic hydroperoxide reductase OsmC/OhrA
MRAVGPEVYKYGVLVEWDGLTGGEAKTALHRLSFDMPKEFNGLGRSFCPDELLLSAVGGCLLTTFLHFKERFKLPLKKFRVDVRGEVKLMEEGYRITKVEAKIEASAPEEEVERVKRFIELAKEYCHITRSLERGIAVTVDLTLSGEKP